MSFFPILNAFQNRSDYHAVDLSKRTLETLNIKTSQHSSLEKYFSTIKKPTGAQVLYGGYLEKRSLYNKKELFQLKNKQRNIHLGLDFWANEGEEVSAPLGGVVHSFKDNKGLGNYGPCIILRHQKRNQTFFTLYGHLSRKSLFKLKTGDSIKQYQIIGNLGNARENGGYVPHLHFQIINDLGDYIGDYPGVCSIEDLEFYKNNTESPTEFLRFLNLGLT